VSGLPRLDVPQVVLGCGNFGGIGSSPEFFGRGESEEEAFALMDAAWETGLRWFDTADAYGGGRSERAIGRWLAATGNRAHITTKTFNAMDRGHDSGLTRDRVLRQIESSLARLGGDRVDLYLMHEAPDVPMRDAVATFEEVVERGLAGAWGISNFTAAQVREVCRYGEPALLQNAYSLLAPGDEAEVIPLCREHGIVYQAFSPLAGGWLTGKYRRDGTLPAGSRMTLRPEPYEHLRSSETFSALETLSREAQSRGTTMAALSLTWLLATGVSAVIGPRRPENLEPVRQALLAPLAPVTAEALRSLFP
jgi:aryl-alcohol dehydrogenase-like predicted oxidoreductase